MRRLLAILTSILVLCQCSPCRHCPAAAGPAVESHDNVRVEYRDRIIRDTVEYELPVIIEKRITDDTLSVIENEYARTAAVVHDGKLSHDLRTKPAVIRVPVFTEVHDTLVVCEKGETITQTVEVEKKFTWWQQLKMKLGGVAFALLACAIIYIVWKMLK